MLRERVMTIFPRSPILDEIREPTKTLTSTSFFKTYISFFVALCDIESCCTCSCNFDISYCTSSSSWVIVEPYEGLMGVELFLRAILEPNIEICASICPWNPFKMIFQTRIMQFLKKIAPFPCFWGDRYWNCCISVILDPWDFIFSPLVSLWIFFPMSHVWPDLESSRKIMHKLPQWPNYGLVQ